MRTTLMMVMPLILALLTSIRPEPRGMDSVDEFLLKRLDEDERRAATDHLSKVDRERIIATSRARRKIVGFYRCSKDRPQGAAYLLVIRVLAELYVDHPDYNDAWHPGVPDTPRGPRLPTTP